MNHRQRLNRKSLCWANDSGRPYSVQLLGAQALSIEYRAFAIFHSGITHLDRPVRHGDLLVLGHVRFMGREHLHVLDVNRGHEPSLSEPRMGRARRPRRAANGKGCRLLHGGSAGTLRPTLRFMERCLKWREKTSLVINRQVDGPGCGRFMARQNYFALCLTVLSA